MNDDVRRQVAELETMTAGQLRERYADVFGEPARSGNRRWLFRRVAWRLQAMEEGDLSERARQRAAELARDVDVRLRPPADMRLTPAPSTLRTASGRIALSRDDRLPIPGTVLTRVFKGHEHRVTVLINSFEHDGRVYRSLSAVAHAITGSHWNGFHFFGLTKSVKETR